MTTTTYKTDSFSFRRLTMLSAYYRRPVTIQLGIYAAITALLFILLALPYKVTAIAIYPTIFIFEVMAYLAPLPFACNGDPVIDTMLPAKVSEKYAYILLHCLVAVPLTIVGVWTLMWACSFWWTDQVSPFWDLTMFTASGILKTFEDSPMWLTLNTAAQIISLLVPVVTAIAIITKARHSPVTKCILGVAASLFGMFIVGAIAGIAAVAVNIDSLKGYATEADILGHPEVMKMLFKLGMYIYIPLIIYVICAFVYSFRTLARRQF